MQIQHIAGYKFIALSALNELRADLLARTQALGLLGTILLSEEGININLAGKAADINAFRAQLKDDVRFADITYHETIAPSIPYRFLKVKIKKEIITMHRPEVDAVTTRAPAIAPAELKKWLSENRDITLLDTRNDYEVQFGTFDKAINLHIDDFGEFPAAIESLDKQKPVVMFCTGGIRCEKASALMLNEGFSEVYQLDRGILGYFADVGGEHYDGSCFVFDERIAVMPSLEPANLTQCVTCSGPISPHSQHNHC